jgi:signal transduction histidine kinase
VHVEGLELEETIRDAPFASGQSQGCEASPPVPGSGTAFSERALVLARDPDEARLILDSLSRAGLRGVLCEGFDHFCSNVEEGMGVALLAEELLSDDALSKLHALLKRQPTWSAYPLVLFSALTNRRVSTQDAAFLGNATFLDRPLDARSLVAAVQAALANRRRQYEARRAIESRDAFLATLGHELRNPLGVLSLAVNSVERNAEDAIPTREHRIIERQVQNLTRLVDDLLDIARVTYGKVSLERAAVDLGEVVRAAVDTLEPRARERQLSWTLRVHGPSPWVEGDRQRLDQVFANLLTNAIKYTPPAGNVTIDVRSDEGSALVTVTDTGVGLSREMCSRIFEPFTQVARSRSRAEGGLGLGLALVRSIVQLHGGSVRAESAGIAQGAAFLVQLPRVSAQATAPKLEESGPVNAAPRRVLVVEDNDDLCDLLAELLRAAGHHVTCARDGPDGLEKLLSLAPNIAFVDIGLPGFDGLELARRARDSASTSWLVALTGYGQTKDKELAKAAGFDDHLVKPVTDMGLAKALLCAPQPGNR